MLKVINIPPQISKSNLRELLIDEGQRYGWNLSTITGKILKYAVKHMEELNEPLKNPMVAGGKDITVKMPAGIKKTFKAWAKESKRNQPQHAVFILEKFLEKKSFEDLVSIDFGEGTKRKNSLNVPPSSEKNSLQQHCLNIYFDPQIMSKDDIKNVLISLNDIYRSLGGKELIILDNEIGVFNIVNQQHLV